MVKRKKLRILHLPIVILYQPYLLVGGLRALGHKADYLVYNLSENVLWLMQGAPDFNLKISTQGILNKIFTPLKLIFFLIKSLFEYDVFHFHSGQTFIPSSERWFVKFFRGLDLKILKLFRKKIVFQWWGCDIRIRELDQKYKYNCCEICHPEIKNRCNSELKHKLIVLTKKYGDLNLSSGDLLVMFPHMKPLNVAIDTSLWKFLPVEEIPEKFLLPKNNNLRIYHSFGNSEKRGDVKGSGFVGRAVDELKKEGYRIEFMFFDKVPNLDLRYYQMQADICVEALRQGCYGSTAIECMAMGKPVVGYIREDVLKISPSDLPIINANPDNIKEVLRKLIENKDLREEIGRKGREFVLREHDLKVVAKRSEEYYYSLF